MPFKVKLSISVNPLIVKPDTRASHLVDSLPRRSLALLFVGCGASSIDLLLFGLLPYRNV